VFRPTRSQCRRLAGPGHVRPVPQSRCEVSDAPLSHPIFSFRGRWHSPSGYREVLALAGPLILSTGTMTIQQFVNRIFLAWYSPEALAACLPAGILSFTVLCFFIGTASYVNTFVAQYHGAGQPQRIAASVWQALYLSLAAGVLVIPVSLLAGPIFTHSGHTPAVAALEASYFRLLTMGGGFVIVAPAVSAYFTGRGLTRTVMVVNIATTLLQMALDYALIFGNLGAPRLGIVGAAYASIIASAAGTFIFLGLFLFGRDRHEYGVWQARRFDRELFGRLLRFGTPSGLHFMLDLLAWSLFVILVGRLGVRELGATNLAFQVNAVVFMPMVGMAIATATLVGQRLGENRPDLAGRTTWSAFHLTMGYMLFFCLLYVLVPHLFLAPFGARANAADFADIEHMAARMMIFVALYSLFDGVNLIFSAALKGAGDTLFLMVTSSSLSFGLMVIPTWLICRDGKGNVWLAWAFLSLFIITLSFCFLGRFLQGKWRTMRVTESFHAPLSPTAAPPDVPVTEAELL
jgi:multidrug resistance protein, MATE family